jgi:alpha-mannosidase
VKRVRDERGPSYPSSYKISEPVAGNYYPVNALASISDDCVEFDVVVDTSLGGASLSSGSLEFMVHRRLQEDDNRGVQEPLNETMCGCNDIRAAPGMMGAHGREGDGGCLCAGLTVRGRHLLVFDEVQRARALRRRLMEEVQQPPAVAFAPLGTPFKRPSRAVLAEALPPNVKLVTLTSTYARAHDGQWLLRLAHVYEAGETTDDLARPVTIDLTRYFRRPGLAITSAVETTLTANAAPAERLTWKTESAAEDGAFTARTPFAYPALTLRPMEVRTFLARFR